MTSNSNAFCWYSSRRLPAVFAIIACVSSAWPKKNNAVFENESVRPITYLIHVIDIKQTKELIMGDHLVFKSMKNVVICEN